MLGFKSKREVQAKVQKIEEVYTTTLRQKEAEHMTIVENLKQKNEEILDDIRSVFIGDIEKEFKIVRKPTIEEMKRSYRNLKCEYEKYGAAIKKAVAGVKILGYDMKDKNFENILKGREFEICIATLLTKNLGYNILEWTPGKGSISTLMLKQTVTLI